jgi:hypothetical protein
VAEKGEARGSLAGKTIKVSSLPQDEAKKIQYRKKGRRIKRFSYKLPCAMREKIPESSRYFLSKFTADELLALVRFRYLFHYSDRAVKEALMYGITF